MFREVSQAPMHGGVVAGGSISVGMITVEYALFFPIINTVFVPAGTFNN